MIGTEIVSGARLPYEQQASPPFNDNASHETDSYEDSDTGGESNGTEIQMLKESLKIFLAELFRLSFRIRDMKSQGVALKAAALRRVDSESGVDLYSVYKTLDRQHVFEYLSSIRGKQEHHSHMEVHAQDTIHDCKVPQNPVWGERDHRRLIEHAISPYTDFENDNLAVRLASANTLRRQCFAYWDRYAPKPALNHELSGISPQNESTVETVEPVMIPGRSHLHSQAATSDHIASRVTVESDIEDIKEMETLSSHTSASHDVGKDIISLPMLLGRVDDRTDFHCPICQVVCSSKQGRGKEWR